MTGYHRDVGPVLQMVRKWLTGFQWNRQQRYQEHLSPRPYPHANLPQGPSDKVSENYYYTRDGRREARLPTEIPISLKQISSGSDAQEKSGQTRTRAPTPGDLHRIH